MPQPFISICIPAYQKPESLQRLLQSILQQTYRNFEVIITDDSKNNNSEIIAQDFIDKFDLKYFRNNPTAGMPENWNVAVSKARYEWIKIMHDDDCFATSNALEIFASYVDENKHNLIFSASNVIEKKNIKVERLEGKKKQMFDEDTNCLVFQNVIGHPSVVLYKKDALTKFDKTFKWVVDVDFYMLYLNKHKSYLYIDETLINITKDEKQVSASCYKNPDVEIPEYLQLINKIDFIDIHKNKYVFFCIWELVRKFKPKEPTDFTKYYKNFSDTKTINEIIKIQKKIPNLFIKQTPINKWLMNFYFRKTK